MKVCPIPPLLLEQAQPIIHNIAKSRKNKHKFAYFDSSDIYQEIYLLCLDALKRYRPSCGELENYLNAHVTNRLKNLKRDKYFRPEKKEEDQFLVQTRINLVNAISIDNIGVSDRTKFLASSSSESDPFLIIETKDLKEFIISNLPEYLIPYFKDLLDGKKINKNILEEIRSCVSVILKEMDE